MAVFGRFLVLIYYVLKFGNECLTIERNKGEALKELT